MDGARLHNQDHYVEDQVMLLDVILLSYFSNNKAEYNSICGKLHRYQKGNSGAFSTYLFIPLMANTGTSIAVATLCKYIWSYAAGYCKTAIVLLKR